MRKFCCLKIFLLSACLALCLPFAATAAQQIGLVLAVRGKVYAQLGAEKERVLQRRSPVFLKDKIISQKDGFAQIRLNDDSLLSIQPDTIFSVETFHFDPKKIKDSAYVGKLVKGALINLSGKGNPDNYKLQGPLSIIAFRGTGVNFRVKGKQEQVGIFSGSIDVRSANSSKRLTYTTQHYKQVVVSADGAIKSAEGSLLFPVTVPAGTMLVESDKSAKLVQIIDDLVKQLPVRKKP